MALLPPSADPFRMWYQEMASGYLASYLHQPVHLKTDPVTQAPTVVVEAHSPKREPDVIPRTKPSIGSILLNYPSERERALILLIEKLKQRAIKQEIRTNSLPELRKMHLLAQSQHWGSLRQLLENTILAFEPGSPLVKINSAPPVAKSARESSGSRLSTPPGVLKPFEKLP